jgi:hypothetical protein
MSRNVHGGVVVRLNLSCMGAGQSRLQPPGDGPEQQRLSGMVSGPAWGCAGPTHPSPVEPKA